MKVALVHYWLVGMRGGEKVLEELCALYPQADIFTHVVDPDKLSDTLRRHTIRTTFINRLPRARQWYQRYLPLMPLALEELDLRDYDLVISSESGPAKGVITRPETLHVCYCHSPMRYLWNMYHDYRTSAGPVTRLMMGPLFHALRQWDVLAAHRVDAFVANSTCVAERIRKYYRREATVIHPPVAVEAFAPAAEKEDFYLVCGQLVPYKRTDIAVEACNRLGRRLVVIGGGEELNRIRRQAGPTVTVLGPQPFDVLRDHYARARALLFPGEEDFGIVPVEAMASGTPVIAYGKGGVLDTVKHGETGWLFGRQTVEGLMRAITEFEALPRPLHSEAIWKHTVSFGREYFRKNFYNFVNKATSASQATRISEVYISQY